MPAQNISNVVISIDDGLADRLADDTMVSAQILPVPVMIFGMEAENETRTLVLGLKDAAENLSGTIRSSSDDVVNVDIAWKNLKELVRRDFDAIERVNVSPLSDSGQKAEGLAL